MHSQQGTTVIEQPGTQPGFSVYTNRRGSNIVEEEFMFMQKEMRSYFVGMSKRMESHAD